MTGRVRVQSIRFRLVVASVLVFGLSSLTLLVLAYSVLTSTQQEDFDISLYNHGIDIASTVDVDSLGNVVTEIFAPPAPNKKRLFSVRRSYMQVRNMEGRIIARSPNLRHHEIPMTSETLADVQQDGLAFMTLPNSEASFADPQATSDFRVLSYLIRRQGLEPMILQVAAPMTLLESARQEFSILFLISTPVVMLVAGGAALGLSRRAFLPVQDLIDQTARVQVTDLSERVRYTAGDPELVRLAQTLNLLLDQVQSSVDLQARFIADASHQLKTPLAVLRGEVATLAHRDNLDPEVRTYVHSIRDELEQLIRLVNDLLLLAKIDAGAGRLELEMVRFDEIAMEAALRLRSVADAKEIRLTGNFSPHDANSESRIDFELLGDGDLLKSMVQTLLENAIKFSPRKTNVSWRVSESETSIRFEVLDEGPGISQDERDLIFERFRQGNEGARLQKGAGLGLSIAKRIAEAHRGRITLDESYPSGCRFIVEMRKI